MILGPIQIAAIRVDEAQVAERVGPPQLVANFLLNGEGLLEVILGPIQIAALRVDEAQVAALAGLA